MSLSRVNCWVIEVVGAMNWGGGYITLAAELVPIDKVRDPKSGKLTTVSKC